MPTEAKRIEIGTSIPEFRLVVDPAPMKLMTLLQRDDNPIHWDVEAVRQLGLGERQINQGVINAGYIYQALINWLGDQRLVRSVSTTFKGNVFAGDVVVAGGQVTRIDDEVEEGLRLTCEMWLDVEGGRRVVSAEAEASIPETWSVTN